MPIVSFLRDGLGRVLGAPVILAAAALLTLALAIPLHELLHEAPPSTMRVGSADDVPGQWWRQCAAPAIGLTRSLESAVTGCAAQLGGLAAPLTGTQPVHTRLVGYLLGGLVVLWTFLSGGILDRYARGRPTRTAGFFSACGLYASRLVRLGLIAGVTYGVLFGPVQGLLFGTLFEWLAGGASPVGQAAVRAGLFVLFGALVGIAGLVFDYARVRAVVEDRRSILGAVLAGWRFVRRRLVVCAGLCAANGLLLVAAVAATPLVAAAPGQVGWLTLVTALPCLVARSAGRLLFYAAEIVYFQSQLAHVGYIAAPTPVWPESPAAEALGRLG